MLSDVPAGAYGALHIPISASAGTSIGASDPANTATASSGLGGAGSPAATNDGPSVAAPAKYISIV